MTPSKKQQFNTGTRTIYCFADSLGLCRKLLDGGARIIQLRNKEIDDASFLRLAQDMVELTRPYHDAILIVNDRVDIAIQTGADGVHVGQEDEDYRQVIRKVPAHMIVGVSVYTVQDAIDAEKAGADYVGAGAAYPTPTKSDVKVIGLETIREIVNSIRIPTAAIGGISLENIRQVMTTGAQYYAIISQINQAQDISQRLKEFFDILAE